MSHQGWRNADEDEFTSSKVLCVPPGIVDMVVLIGVGFFLSFWLTCGWCCCVFLDRTVLRDFDFGDGTTCFLNWTFCFPYYCCKSAAGKACRRAVPVMMRKIWDLIRCMYLRRKIREDRERKDQRLVLLKRWKPPQSKHLSLIHI